MVNHYSKGESYPEKYFNKIFKKENIQYEKFYRTGLYHIDIAILNKSIAIEIDGEQLYLDERIIESDKRKDKFLKENGWDIIRIRWSHFQKMSKLEKRKYIKDLFLYIESSVNKPIIKLKESNNYCECGKKIYKTSKKCNKCASFERRLKRPSYEELINEVNKTNYSSTGRKYKVSRVSIKKWIKEYKKNKISI